MVLQFLLYFQIPYCIGWPKNMRCKGYEFFTIRSYAVEVDRTHFCVVR